MLWIDELNSNLERIDEPNSNLEDKIQILNLDTKLELLYVTMAKLLHVEILKN